MNNYKLTFLNHASFSIETDDFITLVDPWYFNRIFNNSWCLLRDTDDSKLDYSKLRYISVSHEHPDHLHWPTLKYIKTKTDNEITIIFPRRTNPNVMDECKKLGYSFAYIDHYIETEIEEGFTITAFPDGHDSCLVYRIGKDVICNQNDAYLDNQILPKLKEMFPVIDMWLFQFSLAGYYGNSTEPNTIIEKGTKFHLDKFIRYQNYLEPKMSVPFASYVYFCKQYNDYINDYAVKLSDLLNKTKYPTQIIFYNEEISLTSIENNDINLSKWDAVIQNGRDNITPVAEFPGEQIIIDELVKLYDNGYRIEGPGAAILEFFDYDKNLVIDTSNKKFEFISKNETPQQWVAGILPGEELLAYLKTPWGADTLNITGCFIKKNPNLWHPFLMARENLYQR
jgi:hypothetical protein